MEEKIDRSDSKYEKNKYSYDFGKYQAIRSFGENICNGNITIRKADEKKFRNIFKT